MNALPITIFFLLLMALLAYGSLNTGLDKMVELRAVQGALEAQRAAHNAWEQTVYLVEKGKRLKRGTRPPKPKLEVTRERKSPPPKKAAPIIYPTKLNLAQATKKSSQGKLYREVCERFICQLYKDYAPFQQIPQVEGELLDRLLKALKGEKALLLPEHLATLDFGELQPLWQQLLIGDDCPSLLEYVYHKPKDTPPAINVTWAPEPLLHVLFADGDKVERLVELQKALARGELEDKEWGPLLSDYKERAKLEESPYCKILVCQLSTKNESLTVEGRDIEGRAEGEGGAGQVGVRSHMLLN